MQSGAELAKDVPRMSTILAEGISEGFRFALSPLRACEYEEGDKSGAIGHMQTVPKSICALKINFRRCIEPRRNGTCH
jgi:hypothetical protein